MDPDWEESFMKEMKIFQRWLFVNFFIKRPDLGFYYFDPINYKTSPLAKAVTINQKVQSPLSQSVQFPDCLASGLENQSLFLQKME